MLSLASVHADISKLPDTYARKLYGRDSEMAGLLQAWDGGQTRIFAFDAMGGAGKTALAYRFVRALKASGWRGARSVFAWSFHGQGSNEDRQASADGFFKAAFAHFSAGGKAPPRDPHRKGVDLAHLVQAQRALLILDGLEPLQYAEHGGPQSSIAVGGVKDPGVKALLKALADDNPGLCIVTTRIRLAELMGAEGVTFRELTEIPLMEAIALLRDLGAEPATPSASYKLPPVHEFAALSPPYELPPAYEPVDIGPMPRMPAPVVRDLIGAVQELKGHALALTLAGRYLAQHKKGDIRAIRELPDLPRIAASEERAPYRVMRAIEKALVNRIAGQDAIEKPATDPAGLQLALLFFLGLFDGPAERALLPVVFGEAAAELAPATADIDAAKIDPIPIERRLHVLDEELLTAATPEWRRQQIEQLRQPLAATRSAAIEARRRVLVRRLFAGMPAVIGDERKVADTLSQLAEQGLVAPGWEKHACVDCHPLVRDYFGARLKELDGEIFRAAHGRLYDHYRYAGLPAEFRSPEAVSVMALVASLDTAPHREMIEQIASGLLKPGADLSPSLFWGQPEELRRFGSLIGSKKFQNAMACFLPSSEQQMAPVFRAISHGTAADRHDEVFQEVYVPRIQRGHTKYDLLDLGLFDQDLAALAGFFEVPFKTPSPRLSPSRQALALASASFALSAAGRVEDAIAPVRAGSQLQAGMGDIRNAGLGFGNLSELLIAAGWVTGEEGAVAAGEQAVAFAERSGDAFARMACSTSHAYALHQAGEMAHAEVLFRDAEALQKIRQPDLPSLYSLAGSYYCSLLLARGRTTEAAARAEYAAATAMLSRRASHDAAFAQLDQARIALAETPAFVPAPPDCALRTQIALSAFRQANREDHLCRGLLTHAEAVWRRADASAASEPLREAETIAKRGQMPLFLADAHLLRARIQRSEGSGARTCRDQAAALIERHGYGCGAVELALLDAEIACSEKAEDRGAAIAAAIQAIRGEPYRDERTGVAIDGGWWGLLPRLEALLSADDPSLAELRLARDKYNDERDAYLAAQDGRPALEDREAPGDAGLAGHILAGHGARATVEQAPTQKSIGAFDGVKQEEEHDAIREAVYAVLAETLALKAKTAAPDPREAPDALVARVFAAPEAQGLIRDTMRQYGIDGAAADLPFETKRFIVGKLKEHGFLREEAAPPPPAKKRGWWPFARE